MSEYKRIEGQCGTCLWAAGFDYGPSRSGPEDGVRCASVAYAQERGVTDHDPSLEEFQELGYMLLFRLELLEEEDFRCAHWYPGQVLLIPDPEEGSQPRYGIAPGGYTLPELVELLRQQSTNPDAIRFIADMLEA